MTGNSLIIRAAVGDQEAWETLLSQRDASSALRAAAMLMLDTHPSPIAALYASVVLDDRAPPAMRNLARYAARSLAFAPPALCMSARRVATMIAAFGADLDRSVRQTFFDAAAGHPNAIAVLADRAWAALNEDERSTLIRAAINSRNAEAAGVLIARLDVDGLCNLDDNHRSELVHTACSSPFAAACVIEKLTGTGMLELIAHPHTKSLVPLLLEAVIPVPECAARARAGLGEIGRGAMEANGRFARLVNAMDASAARLSHDSLGSVGAARTTDALHTAQWTPELLANAVHHPANAAEAIAALGPQRFASLDRKQRAALLQSATGDPVAAARAVEGLGIDGIEAVSDAERRLLRSAIIGPDASLAVAHAIAESAQWRDWMMDFAPDERASADERTAWRAASEHAPPVIQQEIMRRLTPDGNSVSPRFVR